MFIQDLQQDPIEFVIENEPNLTSMLKEWHAKSLKHLLSSHNLISSGNKDTLVRNIIEGIKLGEIRLVTLQTWFKNHLREGKRHLFIFDIIPEQGNVLKDIETFEEICAEHEEFTRKDLLYQDVIDGLVLFNYSTVDNNVDYISLGYKEKKVIRVPNYETGRIDTTNIDYYIFIDINLADYTMIINLEPTTGLIENNESDTSVSVKTIALRYKESIQNIFRLHFYNMQDVTPKALYKIWQEATKYDLPEVNEILDSITDEVNNFVENISEEEKLNLKHETKTKLTTKILSNIENAIVTDRNDEYHEQIEQARQLKPGYITAQKIRERSGSTLNQKSADKQTPIENSDTFSDTKATIDDLERVQKLYYTWRGLDSIPPGVIPTIIESFQGYDLAIFTSHSTLEEIKHVFSQLKRYKAAIRASRNSSPTTE